MFQFVGLGQCGGRIAELLDREMKNLKRMYNPSVFVNFHVGDMQELSSIQKKYKLLLEGSGTGRSPNKGQEFAEQNKKTISKFLKEVLNPEAMIILVFGAGGGSGSGLAPVIVPLLHDMGYKVGVAMTFPDNSAATNDLAINQNSIHTLNKMMELQDKIKPFILIDNEHLINTVHYDPKNWWSRINRHIVTAFYSTAQLFDYGADDVVSSSKSMSNFDEGELKRIFYTEGFTDIRVVQLPESSFNLPSFDQKFKDGLEIESLSGKYSLSDTICYGVSVVMNPNFDRLDKVNGIFELIAKETPGAGIRRIGNVFRDCYYVDPEDGRKIPTVKVVMVAGGFKLPKEINKKIKLIKRDAKKFHKVKNKKSKVVIDQSILNDNIQDKFEI
jgi:cell division GTPase FtsZ